MAARAKKRRQSRQAIPRSVVIEVLTESGYRCAVPTCRTLVVLDLHHIVPVRLGGPSTAENLLALCPTCHALFERGKIGQESIAAWKAFLQSLTRAYDHRTLDLLQFLRIVPDFGCTADGVVAFAQLVGSGLAELDISPQRFGAMVGVRLSEKGRTLLSAWESANIAFLIEPRAGIGERDA